MEVGKTIGGYRILSPLGAGGMGEVWRAEDEKLGREVALKVLPFEFAGDAERMARFEREAKILASLNHPNIAHLYGLETVERTVGEGFTPSRETVSSGTGTDADSDAGSIDSNVGEGLIPSRDDDQAGLDPAPTTFLVMELVEGEDLSERIARGPLPIDEAIPIARQIAEALEAAHDQGIVHRDLKPANIKLRSDGTVKVLDFGLAKAWETESTESSLSLSPTMTQHATAAGLILGTAAYMSPEQAAGTAADRRADTWSFGVVFWEMLTGHKLFDGETVSHVLASVLKDELDLEELPTDIPPQLRVLVSRCLERDPRRRLQAIGEARITLEEIERHPTGSGSNLGGDVASGSGSAASGMRFPRWAAILTAVILVGVSFAAGWIATRSDPVEPRVLQAEISPPEGTIFSLQAIAPGAAQISPDGSKIVFGTIDPEGKRILWLRRVGDSGARQLPGTEGAAYPFWAPDSRRIGFFSADGKLRKIDTSGGPPVTICMARNGKGGSWSDRGEILFAPAHDSAIYLVPAAGGEPIQVTEISPGATSHRLPTWLSGGRFLYLARSAGGPEGDRIVVGSIDAEGQDPDLLAAASNTAVAGGFILFIREGTLMAQPFDEDRPALIGDAIPVAEDVLYVGGARFGAFSVSDDGLLVYNTGRSETKSEIVWVDQEGGVLAKAGEGALLFDIVVSPDGRSAAVTELDSTVGTADIWIYDLERELRTRFTFDPTNDWYPAWSPDGRRIAFASARAGRDGIWTKGVGGSEDAQPLLEEEGLRVFPQDWSPDGKFVVYERFGNDNNTDLWAIRVDDGEKFELVASPYIEGFAAVSPDGRWMAFTSNESGRDEVYVTTFPEPARRWQVSTTGGTFPRWSRDGNELYFGTAVGDLLVAEVGGDGEAFDVGRVRALHSWNLATSFRRPFDVTADGEDLLVIRGQAMQSRDPLKIVLNWDAALDKERR